MAMSDPSPAYCFTIPSICDSTPLDCRIYHPPSLEEGSDGTKDVFSPSKKAAIVAHPYAPLGGSFDDPVVMTIVEQLLDLDFIVGTFNFRGAHDSKGSTSWTGKAERDDYVSVAGHMIFYVDHIKSPIGHSSTPKWNPDLEIESSETISLILGGYSYGSLIVTQLPPVTDILQLFHNRQPGDVTTEILLRAEILANQTNEHLLDLCEARGRKTETSGNQGRGHTTSNSRHSIVYGGNETPSPAGKSRTRSVELVRKSVELPKRITYTIRHSSKSIPTPSSRTPSAESHTASPDVKETQGMRSLPHVSVHYLLISPLLPPLSNFLSLSTMGMSLLRRQTVTTETLVRNPTLVVFGSVDGFTSATRLVTWCRKMQALSVQNLGAGVETRFRWEEVEGGGHFWRERGVAGRLREVLREWVGDVAVL